jgi:hypothetical protein
MEQRTLAGARFSHNGDDLAFFDFNVHPFENVEVIVRFMNV